MKILKQAALILLVSGGALLAFTKCPQLNLEAMRASIPHSSMDQLLKHRKALDGYIDCLNREQELTDAVWTQNQNETIARRAAHAAELEAALKAQTERLNHEQGEVRRMTPAR